MRPEEKEWWRQKHHNDYEKAKQQFHEEQLRQTNKGSGGCLVLIFFPFAAFALLALAKTLTA